MGTGTYAPRRTRASHPDLDHAARRRAATSGVSPRAAAAWVGVTMGGLSRSSLLNWLRDVALRPAGRMRYILSERTSSTMTFLRSVYSFFGLLAPLTGPQLDQRAADQSAPFKRLHGYRPRPAARNVSTKCPTRQFRQVGRRSAEPGRSRRTRAWLAEAITSPAAEAVDRPHGPSRCRGHGRPALVCGTARRGALPPSTAHTASPLAR